MKHPKISGATTALFLFLGPGIVPSPAQGTAFAYQGRLNDGNAPATGAYDLTFALYATNIGGAILAGPLTNSATPVTHGLFSAVVDFGNAFNGDPRWLEIGVTTNGGPVFTILAPRQPLTAVPYAIAAGNLSGPLALAQLPPAVVTNGAADLSLAGSFSGNGAALTNLAAANIVGAFASLAVGDNFRVDSSGNVTANHLASLPGVAATSLSATAASFAPTNYAYYPLDLTASNFVVLGTSLMAGTNPAEANFCATPQTGVSGGVDPPAWSLAFGIDGGNFVFHTLDAGQSVIISVDGHDANPPVNLPNDGNDTYAQVTLTAPGFHWLILKNINNAFGIYAPITNGFFATPPAAYRALAILGDSFLDITPTNTFADYLAEDLPGLNVCKFGEGGTGWKATQAPSFHYTNFLARLGDLQPVNPAYILFAGGINDVTVANADTNAFYQQVYNTALAAKAAYPNAKFAVLSPFWPQSPVYYQVITTSLIISNACVAAGLILPNQFFDILSPPLVTGNQGTPNSGTANQYTSADTTHPTAKGAAAIAHWLAAKMANTWPELSCGSPP